MRDTRTPALQKRTTAELIASVDAFCEEGNVKTAENISFVADENGWEMHITDENGFVQRYNIHGIAWNLPDQADATIGAWRREGLSAVGAADSLLGSDAAAYEPGDPKWLSTEQADIDMMRDRAEGF